MSLPIGVALTATFKFYKAGVLTDPSVLPTTVTASLYPDGTAGPTAALTHASTGVFTATAFTSGQNTLIGTYEAWVYVSDATLDSQWSDVAWVDVGINNVTAIANGVITAATFAANALDAVWSTPSRTLTAFDFTVNANMVGIIATALTETTTGWLAAAFKKLFNVAVPTMDMTNVNQTGDSFTRLGAPAGASVSADIAEVEAETDGIAAIPTNPLLTTDARLPASAVAGTAGGLPLLDSNLAVNANVIDTGTAQGGSLTGITLKAGSSAVDDFYKGQGVRLTTGPGAGQFGSITAYSGTTKLASVVFVTAPTSATTYELLAAGGGSSGGGDPATIAAAVWNSLTASYTLSGSFGALLTSIYNKLSSAVNTFISPVATNMDTTIYADRDFNSADGLSLIYPTNITVGVSDTITWNAGPQGSPYVSITGYYISANSVGVNITAAQGADFPGNSDTTFEVVVTRSGNGRKIQAVTGKLTIDGVIVA